MSTLSQQSRIPINSSACGMSEKVNERGLALKKMPGLFPR